MLTPRNYDSVTSEISRGAQAAISNDWLFSEYLQAIKEAWVLKHEDMLRQAKYQVEHTK